MPPLAMPLVEAGGVEGDPEDGSGEAPVDVADGDPADVLVVEIVHAELPDVLRPLTAAAVLGVSRNAIYQALREKTIFSVRCGRTILIPKQSIIAFLKGETGT